MKKIIEIFFIVICFSGNFLYAQTIFSNGTGGGYWNDGTTWVGGVVPNATNDVVIAGTDSVYTGAGAGCYSLTVYSGGKFATSVDTVQVVTSLTLEDNAYFYNQVDKPELPGNQFYLDDNSYVVHMGSGTVGGDDNNEFGNLVISRNEGVVPGADLTINGNLIINNPYYNVVFRGTRPTTGSQTHTVHGNVYINKGILSCVDVGADTIVGIWNIDGNVYVVDDTTGGTPYLESRIGPFSSASAAGLGIINIGGDLIIQGGRLQAGTSSTHGFGTGVINLGGDLIMDKNSAVSTNHEGPLTLNFVGSGTQTVNMDVRFQMSTDVYDTIKAGSNVVFDLDTNKWGSSISGDFVVNGSLELKGNSLLDGMANFTLNPGATLKIGSLDGISSAGNTGNVRVSGTRAYDAGANYEYKGDGIQSLGDALPNPVNGFGVNNPSGITLDRDLTVNSSVNVINGDLELNGHTVTLGSDALLTENAGNTVTGADGKITITTDLNAPAGVNVGGLGAWISSGSNLGSTTIERFHSARSGAGNGGILRYFNIAPTNNSGFNATLRFYYDELELNGIPEANLRLFQSADGSDDTWNLFGGSVDETNNYVEMSGISEFSFWTLGDVDNPLPVKEESSGKPVAYALYQNYPNPFNPETKIRFELPEDAFVNLSVYNILGELVSTLVNENLHSGVYYQDFDAKNLPSGLYIYKLKTEKTTFTKKMMLIK
jgi:hypothetical protein